MACPTCDHTMSKLGVLEGRQHYHCPRCGTHRMMTGDHIHDTLPRLVERCRAFEQANEGNRESWWADQAAQDWRRLGIAEAINPPGKRPV